jgi:hypothetical protein
MPYVGQKVLEEGSYIWHNCLKWFLDPERRYPVELNLDAMFQNIVFEVNGDKLTLFDVIANLENGETFSWLIYATFNSPLGDSMLEMEILPNSDIEGVISVKINKQISEQKPLKSGDNFKILVTFSKNKSWEEFLKKERPIVSFGLKGKGRRTGTS